MTNDRELLENAAKAAGFQNYTMREDTVFVETGAARGDSGYYWNPIADDGDALRLAVRLRFVCGFVQPNCWAELPGQYPSYEPCEPDPLAATRRAIVRAAAEIGKGTKPFPTAEEIRKEWT